MAVAQQSRLQTSLQMEPGIERPQSALARGVQITEFKESHVNPEPVVLEESDVLIEQFLSPRKLRLLTGIDNLEDITVLEMKVNTSDTSLGNFGQFLPNLRQLKVSNSTIPYIRDLGSSLRSVSVMWASRCCLLELDGISAMCNLREVYLSYNEITDISPISMLEQIEILDLEGNNIDDIVQVQYLALCNKLTNLTLEGNPICVYSSPGEESVGDYDYRQAVKKAIPHLKTLDDELLIEGVGSFQKHNVFDADWAYLQELQNDIHLGDDSETKTEDARPSSGNRPSTAALKTNSGYRPGTALRPSSGFRPLTAGPRPSSMGARPATAIGGRPSSGSNRPSSGGDIKETTDASDLTLGRVICGNPSKALLSRRRLNPDANGKLDTEGPDVKFEPKFTHKVEHSYDPVPEEFKDRTEIIDELKAWRMDHEVRMEKIRAEQAPQVLKIDHDDAVSLSGGESEIDSDEEISPLRDDDGAESHKTLANQSNSNDTLLQSESTFIPTYTNHQDITDEAKVKRPSSRENDSSAKSDKLSFRSKSIEDDSELLLKSTAVDNTSTFRISDFKRSRKVKEVIPPPSERDIVRKHAQIVPTERPLVPQGLQGALNNEVRVRSPGPALKVNMATGLPKSQTGGPVMSKVRRTSKPDLVWERKKVKEVIPPPSERDIVRKHAQIVPTERPLVPQGLQGALNNEVRVRSPGPALKVNMATGLPKSQTGGPVMSKVRRSDELLRDPAQPVIRGSGYDRPVPPPSQRPSTARAALGIPAVQPKIRRSLPSVPSLPSKPPAPTK